MEMKERTDRSRRKKRERKKKGSNAPGSHSLSKMSSSRMNYEDEDLDRDDFFDITKTSRSSKSSRFSSSVKRRHELVECILDDRLSKQKTAVEEMTQLFPHISIMAETLLRRSRRGTEGFDLYQIGLKTAYDSRLYNVAKEAVPRTFRS